MALDFLETDELQGLSVATKRKAEPLYITEFTTRYKIKASYIVGDSDEIGSVEITVHDIDQGKEASVFYIEHFKKANTDKFTRLIMDAFARTRKSQDINEFINSVKERYEQNFTFRGKIKKLLKF